MIYAYSSIQQAQKVILVALIALLGALLLRPAGTSGESPMAIAERILQLQTLNDELAAENARLQLIQDLSSEFSMDAGIVAVVEKYARQYVDPSKAEWRLIQTPEFMTYLMLSVIHAESRGKVRAVGDGGKARGLTQIWSTTAAQYGDVSPQELLEPATNIDYSFRHFHSLLKRYRGNIALTLYAWNRGSGKVDRLISYGESPANGYGRKVYRAALEEARGAD